MNRTSASTRYFANATQRVYMETELVRIAKEHASEWSLPVSWTASRILSFLTEETPLQQVQLDADNYRPIRRYAWPGFSTYELAASLRRRSYLCHGTAVRLLGLVDRTPATLFVNQEQSKKPLVSGDLSQDRLDRAFRRDQRRSNYTFTLGETPFTLLSGKHTGQLGVTHLAGDYGERIPVAGLERTLVDIVVRPAYAGGIQTVAEAYSAARSRVSIDVLEATLKGLDYAYPYHQAIGFLMERAGYPPSLFERFRNLGLPFDFYLAHGMIDPEYDADWRLYVPQGI